MFFISFVIHKYRFIWNKKAFFYTFYIVITIQLYHLFHGFANRISIYHRYKSVSCLAPQHTFAHSCHLEEQNLFSFCKKKFISWTKSMERNGFFNRHATTLFFVSLNCLKWNILYTFLIQYSYLLM